MPLAHYYISHFFLVPIHLRSECMCHTKLLYVQQQPYFLIGFIFFHSFIMFDVIFCASFDQRERECYFFAHTARTKNRTRIAEDGQMCREYVHASVQGNRFFFPLSSCCIPVCVSFSRSTFNLPIDRLWQLIRKDLRRFYVGYFMLAIDS